MAKQRPKPVVLIVCDGFGVAPPGEGNAIINASTPVFDRLVKTYPAMTVISSGVEVGLSRGEMGNSEVGHLNIGAGRVYYQMFPRINKAIADGSFLELPALTGAIDHAKKNNSRLHVMGIISPGNVHGSEEHVWELLKLAKAQEIREVYIHAFLDGRDVAFDTGKEFIARLQEKSKEIGVGKIATLSGRYYAMDRDNRWERIESVYNAMVKGEAKNTGEDPLQLIQQSYDAKVYDEEFVPAVITSGGKPVATVQKGDAIIFSNFRPDRARQLTKAFVIPAFEKFSREYIDDVYFGAMAEYEKGLPVEVAFPPEVVTNCLAQTISKAGLTQFHIAETEKYAHITFFLNGTIEEPFAGEDRKIIPSPKVDSYAQAPEMSAAAIAKETVKVVEAGTHDVIVLNFANADMVGHTGDLQAVLKGVEAIDASIGKIVDATLAKDGVVVITADHGNGEELLNVQTGDMIKEHTTNPVPFVVIGKQWEGVSGPGGDVIDGDLSLMPPVGILADVAPTLLHILGIDQPAEMTGRSLL